MEYSSADKVAVGSDGDIWCIDSNTMLKRYDWRRQDFIRIYFPPEGDPVRDVSVGDKRDIWSVSSKGNLLRYQGSKVANHLKWEKMAENTKLVAVGPDGAVMTVQSDGIVALHTP